jgi:nicotinate-nucleotide adenylyltransferase
LPEAEPTTRLGLLGGTFDPPHVGHLAVARRCREVLDLDRVLLVVANDPWQKSADRPVTPAEDRFAMVQAAVDGLEGLEASRIEIDRGGPSYTVDTVEEILEASRRTGDPIPQVFVIIVADLTPSLSTWERPEVLAKLVTLAIVARPHHRIDAPSGWQAVTVEGLEYDLSSSELRSQLRAGALGAGLIPDSVIHCIGRRNLYAGA